MKALEVVCNLVGVNNIKGKRGIKVPNSDIKYHIFQKFKVNFLFLYNLSLSFFICFISLYLKDRYKL